MACFQESTVQPDTARGYMLSANTSTWLKKGWVALFLFPPHLFPCSTACMNGLSLRQACCLS